MEEKQKEVRNREFKALSLQPTEATSERRLEATADNIATCYLLAKQADPFTSRGNGCFPLSFV